MTARRRVLFAAGLILMAGLTPTDARGEALPPVDRLPAQPDLPDPLVARDGRRVATPDDWSASRRPELIRLFQHYMYGVPPQPPANLRGVIEREDRAYFDGRATKKQVTLRFGPPETPAIHLLLLVPNERSGPAPVFVGLNFCGNHALLEDPDIPLPEAWVPAHCPGCQEGRATDAGRGVQKDVWALEQTIARGYAVATCYAGDIDPDRNDFTDGVHPHFQKPGLPRGPHDWGTIAAWAWGLSRCADYLVTDRDIDPAKIAVVGHSRLGKTALLAGALDERFALVIPHQAGCGGTAPSRKTADAVATAESVKRINTSFPHWFCDEFKQFNDRVDRLPFDQHGLIALCAPRPVLLTNAVEDAWADPRGQFRMLQAAAPVYRLLGATDVADAVFPELDTLLPGRLGYFIRPGPHSMTAADWRVFLDYADLHMRAGGGAPRILTPPPAGLQDGTKP